MKPPSPPCLPLIGHIPAFRRDVLGLLTRSVQTYGDFIRFKLGPHPIYLVNHPDDITHILKKNAANYDKDTRSTRFLRDIADESLLTSNGEQWKKRRHHLQPAYLISPILGLAPHSDSDLSIQGLQHWSASSAEHQEPSLHNRPPGGTERASAHTGSRYRRPPSLPGFHGHVPIHGATKARPWEGKAATSGGDAPAGGPD